MFTGWLKAGLDLGDEEAAFEQIYFNTIKSN